MASISGANILFALVGKISTIGRVFAAFSQDRYGGLYFEYTFLSDGEDCRHVQRRNRQFLMRPECCGPWHNRNAQLRLDALQGTTRLAHYYARWDDIFTNLVLGTVHPAIRVGIPPADGLEQLAHSMCYAFSRVSKAVKIPAPVFHADIACDRARRYLAEEPTGWESTTVDNKNLGPKQQDMLCCELQEKLEVRQRLDDEMAYT